MERVGREWAAWRLAGVRPPMAASTASMSIRRREHGLAVDRLGHRGGSGLGGAAALGVEADPLDPPVGDGEGEPRRSPQAAPPAAPVKAPSSRGPAPGLVAQVVLEELPIHRKG